MKRINYARTCTAIGRNGAMKQVGINIWESGLIEPSEYVSIYPVNTRGEGHGMLQIPKENLREVAEALLKLAGVQVVEYWDDEWITEKWDWIRDNYDGYANAPDITADDIAYVASYINDRKEGDATFDLFEEAIRERMREML